MNNTYALGDDEFEESYEQLGETEKYRLLFDNASDLIAVVDKKGNFIDLNKKFEEESHYHKNEMLGKNVFTSGIVTKKASMKLLSIFSKVIKGEHTPIIEVEGVTKNGDLVPYELRAVPLFKNKKVVAAQAILRNLTERKEHQQALAKSRRKYLEIFNRSRDGFVMVDENGRILDVNGAYCTMLGYTKEELQKFQNFYEITPKRWRKWEQNEIWNNRLLKQGYSGRYEKEYIKKDGTIFPVELESYLVRDDNGNIDYLWGVARDITKKKNDEKERERRLKEMNLITDVVVNASRMQDIDKLCKYVGKTIQSLNEKSYVAISLYDPVAEGIRIRSLCGFESVSDSLNTLFKENPVKNVVKPRKIRKDSQLYLSGQLRPVPGGLYAIMADTLSKEKCREVEKLLGITATYRVGLSLNKKPFGSISILLKEGEKIHFKSAIETIANHFSVIIHEKQAEIKVKKSREQFQNLFDNLKDGVFVHSLLPGNRPGPFEQTNKAASNILGYSPEEFKQMSPWDLDDPDNSNEYIPKVMHQLKEKGEAVFEAVQVAKDGKKIPVEVNASIVEYDGKRSIISVTRDISERKKTEWKLRKNEERLRESERDLKESQKLAKLGRWDYIHGEEKLVWNEMIFDIFEIDPELFDETYESFLAKIHPDDREKVNNSWKKSLQDKDSYTIEHRLLFKDNRVKWVKEKCRTEFDELGKPVHSIGIVQDITDQKKAEERLKNAHETLKKMNQTLEKKVEERTSEVQQLLKQKDEFINQLGHDLKNPLGPFLQLLPILENHVSNEKDKHLVQVLNRNANYMRNLVKKTIDLAKLNSSKTKFSFENVSLGDIVTDVVAVNVSLFDDNDVTVDNNVSTDCLVHVDPLHIEEVFTNLFNNAVKYSNDEQWICIDAFEKDNFVIVSVHDKGIGISNEQLPFLFDEYYKADESRHDFDSSGLGLPICKRIIAKHGGKIWAESKGIGHGSTFYFTLPKSEKNHKEKK